jgi:hypothetical protein
MYSKLSTTCLVKKNLLLLIINLSVWLFCLLFFETGPLLWLIWLYSQKTPCKNSHAPLAQTLFWCLLAQRNNCRYELKKQTQPVETNTCIKGKLFSTLFFSEQALLALTWHVHFAADLPRFFNFLALHDGLGLAWFDLFGLGQRLVKGLSPVFRIFFPTGPPVHFSCAGILEQSMGAWN